MPHVFLASLTLAVLKLGAFLLEGQFGFLQPTLHAFGVNFNTGGQGQIFAAFFAGVVFFVFGVFLRSSAMILMPVFFCAGELALLGQPLGLQGTFAGIYAGDVVLSITILSIVGAIVLIEMGDMWRVRIGRVHMLLMMMVALALVNTGFYKAFTLPLSDPKTLWIIVVACFIAPLVFMLMISLNAETLRNQAYLRADLAKKVPGLEAQITAKDGEIKKEIERADKNYKAWQEQGAMMDSLKAANARLDTAAKEQAARADKNFKGWQERGVEIGELKGANAVLNGRVLELERALGYKNASPAETSVASLKAA